MLQSIPLTFKRNIGILVIIISLFLMTGCGIADNGYLTITNATDRTIRVYYEKDEDVGDSIDDLYTTETKSEVINIPASPSVNVESIWTRSFLTDGSVRVVYGGIVKEYPIDFGLLGIASLDVLTSDFEARVGL